MSVEQKTREDAELRAENVGGIEETEVTFTPGVSVLAGRNATNRTSLLRAVMAACGSDDVAVKGDADEASVELAIGDETYTRRLTRQGGRTIGEGEPYLEDPTLADLFAFLLETNEARRAITTGEDLRDLIMRPVDTEEIQAEIDRLVDRREELQTELEEIESLKGDLPELEEERTRLRDRIDEKRAELEAKEEELAAADADVEETQAEKAELEEALAELREQRSTLEDVRYDLETERESLESLRAEHADLEDELADLADAPVGEIEEVESEIERLRSRKQSLETEITDLQSVIEFNESRLDGSSDVPAALDGGSSEGTVTDQLLEDDEVTCWTCGTEVETDAIEATLDRLRDVNQEKLGTVSDIDAELDDLKAERRELEEQQRRRDQLERRIARLEDDIEDSEATIEALQERREALTEEIAEIEARVEDLEDGSDSTLLDLHREANQLEYELGRLENDLDRVEDNIGTIESRIETQDEIEADIEAVNDEIEDLRTKIERVETQAIEEFNEHMDTVLTLLDYDNLDRIWLERVEKEVREGRRKVHKTTFELHVVRSTESGATYEDTVAHLSESEREVTGLVFALAGYLAHDVHEECPFVLLDSLEAIDSDRIATLVDYLTDYSTYLVVALLPEDADALDDGYQRITEI